MGKSILGIIGAGGFGREVAQFAIEINKEYQNWREVVFLDDNIEKGTKIDGVPVIGTVDDMELVTKEDLVVVCAIGNPRIKYKVVQRALREGLKFTNMIHPSAYIANVQMGTGNIIGPYTVITTNVILGNHVAVNPQCGIGHDAIIEDYSSLYWNVNLSGHVKIGIGSELGTKVTIIQGKTIGDWTIIGAGAVVTSDLPSECTAVGVPARVMKVNGGQ